MKPLFTQELLKKIQEENSKNWDKFWQENQEKGSK